MAARSVGRHGRARRRLFGRVRAAEVVVAAGLLAVVAFRPDALQPVGTFVSDVLVQEADADDGGSTITPASKDQQAKPGKDSRANDTTGDKQEQKNNQRG